MRIQFNVSKEEYEKIKKLALKSGYIDLKNFWPESPLLQGWDEWLFLFEMRSYFS